MKRYNGGIMGLTGARHAAVHSSGAPVPPLRSAQRLSARAPSSAPDHHVRVLPTRAALPWQSGSTAGKQLDRPVSMHEL
jgi:hypothetical protein